MRKPMWLPDGKAGPNLLPPVYADPRRSDLLVTVKPGGGNVLELKLRSGPRGED